MATVVCQGLPSLFVDPPQKADPPLLLYPAMTIRLKLAPPKPADIGSDFLHHSLSSTSPTTTNNPPQRDQPGTAAVMRKDDFAPAPVRHPPPVKLSERSLQLCTENLGSETGTDDVSGWDSLFSNVRNYEVPRKSPSSLTRQFSGGRKVSTPREIPPPLTTLRGAEALQVRAQREEGRLVINAVKSPPMSPCLRAERADGRLRLSLIRDEAPEETDDVPHSCDREVIDEGRETESGGCDQRSPPIIDTEPSNGLVEKIGIIRNDTTEVTEHTSMNMELFLFGEEDYLQDEEITNSKFIPSIRTRCNEGEHEHHHHHHQSMMLLNREPLWVATS